MHTCLHLREALLPATLSNVPCVNELNTSIWTIPLEFSCYLLLLCLGILGAFKLHKLIPLALFLLVLTFNIMHYYIYMQYNAGVFPDSSLISYVPADKFEDYLNLEHLMLFFISGSCFYYYRKYIPRSIYLVILSACLVIISAKWISVFELVQSVFGTYVLFYFIYSNRLRLHRFARYGDLSYGIYLFGWPIQQLVILYFGDRMTHVATLFVSLPIILAMSFVSWHWIEKPALSLKNKTIYPGLYNRAKLAWVKVYRRN